MNIWTLRKKLNQSSNHQTPVEFQPAQIVQPVPAQTPAAPAAVPPAPEPREQVGLNDLFELEDTEIRAISPRLTFSTLKKPAF